jgi:hypothetical protein
VEAFCYVDVLSMRRFVWERFLYASYFSPNEILLRNHIFEVMYYYTLLFYSLINSKSIFHLIFLKFACVYSRVDNSHVCILLMHFSVFPPFILCPILYSDRCAMFKSIGLVDIDIFVEISIDELACFSSQARARPPPPKKN